MGSVTTSFSRNGYGEIDDVSTQVGAAGVYSTDVLARDASGRILSRREVVEGETHAFGYTYDIIGRLTDVAIDSVPRAHYDYDDNGNRLAVTRSSVPCGLSGRTT